jgi:hypothetical protein
MSSKKFRVTAGVLIAFNILGTILTWAVHLTKPGTSAASAIGGGTQFTGPLVLVAVALIALLMAGSGRRWLAVTGTVLVTLFAAGFTVGEVSELFQHNVGISAAKWDVVLAGAVVGAILGICSAVLGVRALLARRAARRADPAPVAPAPQVLR